MQLNRRERGIGSENNLKSSEQLAVDGQQLTELHCSLQSDLLKIIN